MFEVPEFELWLEFEAWESGPEDDPTDDFCNIEVTLADGRRYALDVWTYDFVRRAPYAWSYEAGVGEPEEYLEGPDLLVARLDRGLLERAITKMLAEGGLNPHWLCPPDDDDDDDDDDDVAVERPTTVEEAVTARIVDRFGRGFVVESEAGLVGQLRVPEMSPLTANWERSGQKYAGIGQTIEVYVVEQGDHGVIFSELSALSRAARDCKRADWLRAHEEARVGTLLDVRIEHKLAWGCVCRQEGPPFLEGVLATPQTVAEHQLPPECAVGPQRWGRLLERETVSVVIAAKRWRDWRHVLYFSLYEPPTDSQGSGAPGDGP